MPSRLLPQRRVQFTDDLVRWLNLRLVPEGVTVTADTQLFSDGVIDSVKILELIAWTERALGRRIPDRMIQMDLFGSANRIADAFLEECL